MCPESGSTEVKISVIGAGFKLTPISQDHRIYHYELNFTKSEFTKMSTVQQVCYCKANRSFVLEQHQNFENGTILVPHPV